MSTAGGKAGFALLMVLFATAAVLFASRSESADVLTKVSALGDLSADDSLAWSQLGADSSVLSSTLSANSTGSGAAGVLAITGSLAGSGSLASVVCPAPPPGPCSWRSDDPAGFAAGDTVIWTSDTANGGNGPLTLSFNHTVKGVGAMVQADGPGKFTAQIEAFNGSVSLGPIAATSDDNGDAIFVGVLDSTAANISSVVFSVTSCVGDCGDFAIGTIALNTTGSGPTPTATATPVPSPTLTVTSTVTATATAIAPTATVTATPTPTPGFTTSMLATPPQINFGTVDASGSSKSHKVSLANKGVFSAMLATVSVPSNFAVVAGTDGCSNQSILPKGRCTMMVQFSPNAPGPASGSLSVGYNGTPPATVALAGTGNAVALRAPSNVNFAPVAASGIGKAKPVTITNPSKTATVQIGAIIFSGLPFIIASDTCSNAPILPRGKCTLELEASPPLNATSKSTFSGTLDIPFTYGANSGLVPTVRLNGRVK